MSGSTDDNQFEAPSPHPSPDSSPSDAQSSDAQGSKASQGSKNNEKESCSDADEAAWAEVDQFFLMNNETEEDGAEKDGAKRARLRDDGTYRIASPLERQDVAKGDAAAPQNHPLTSPNSHPVVEGASLNGAAQDTVGSTSNVPVDLVETAFLASTASLLWLISYYLSVVPWMRIFFPAPIALVYLRWGSRSAWMAAIVSCLLLSVLMGPYLSILFLIPYGLLGVQLGALWRRGAPWSVSIAVGTLLSTLSFFFRVGLLSAFLGEDLWVYLTGRITDLLEWVFNLLVNWGFVGIGSLGQPSLALVQIATVVMVISSDIVYLFTVHLTVWLMFERLKAPIPAPPQWVQVLLEEE